MTSSKQFLSSQDTVSKLIELLKHGNTEQVEEFLALYKPNLRDPEIASQLPYLAKWTNDPNIIDLLIKHGATVHPPATLPNCPSFLHVAVDNGKTDIVKRLLRYGADPNLLLQINSESFATSPLYKAVMRRDLNAIRLLLKYGANPNLRNGNTTPLQLALSARASHANSDEIIKQLTAPPKGNNSQQATLGIDESGAADSDDISSDDKQEVTSSF